MMEECMPLMAGWWSGHSILVQMKGKGGVQRKEVVLRKDNHFINNIGNFLVIMGSGRA